MSPKANLNEATFVFGLNIDAAAARNFSIELYAWSGNNPNKPLRINQHSGGGNIGDAELLYETYTHLRRRGHLLTIAVHGRAASCAGWLVQSADVRIIGPHSEILVHEVSSAADGPLSVMKREIERMERLQEKTLNILVSRCASTSTAKTPLTVEKVKQMIDGGRDWWLSAQEALDYGLVDYIEETPAFRPAA